MCCLLWQKTQRLMRSSMPVKSSSELCFPCTVNLSSNTYTSRQHKASEKKRNKTSLLPLTFLRALNHPCIRTSFPMSPCRRDSHHHPVLWGGLYCTIPEDHPDILSCENLLHLKNSFTTIDLQPRCDPEMTSPQSHHSLNVVGGQSTCFDGAAEACVDWSQSSGTSPRGLHKQAWAYVEINLQCGAAGALEQITPTRQPMSSWEWIRYSGPWI